ncbi:MAG: peptide deformylase [Bacteroides sp.]|jgi:peptide deformylase|nr:peptide deformylase [Bacteroides sp.]
MILPIVAYGDPVLKTKAREIPRDYPELGEFIQNMFETMYQANGVGLAAPQVGKSLRLFVVDASPFDDEDPKLKDLKKVFINPVILEKWGEEWLFNEGCLSFPDLREDIYRPSNIRIKYHDENFQLQEEEYDGIGARIIQHEYDHVEGVVMVDRISPLKRRLIRNKLLNISKGNVHPDYPMKFPLKKK